MSRSSSTRSPLGPWKPAAVWHESIAHALLLVLSWISGLGYVGLLLVLAFEVPMITLLTMGLYPGRGLRRQLWDLVKVGFLMCFLLVFVLVGSGGVAGIESAVQGAGGTRSPLELHPGLLIWALALASLHLGALRLQAQRHRDPRLQWARLALVQGAINLFTVFALIFVGVLAMFAVVPLHAWLDPPWRPDAPMVLVAVALRYALALVFSRMTEAELDEIARNPYVD
jgi:hypothetical protein